MSKKVEFSQEQINEIIKLHYEGYLNRQIGQLFNTSKTKIGHVLRENNISSRHPWMSREREKDIIECYNEHRNLAKVGRLLNANPQTVKEILIKNNIEVLDMSHVRRKYTLNENYFDELDSPEKCYYFGLLMADGYLNEKTNTLTLTLQIKDIDIIEKFNNAIGSNRTIKIIKMSDKNPNWSDQASLNITNKHLKETLVSKGLVSNKSLIIKFPEGIIPEEYYPAFILGYSDGDGHYSKNPKDKRVNFVGTQYFCESVKKILKEKLNINSSIMYCHRETEKPTRVLQIAGSKQVKKYLDWLYNNCNVYLNRKHQIYLDLYHENINSSRSD